MDVCVCVCVCFGLAMLEHMLALRVLVPQHTVKSRYSFVRSFFSIEKGSWFNASMVAASVAGVAVRAPPPTNHFCPLHKSQIAAREYSLGELKNRVPNLCPNPNSVLSSLCFIIYIHINTHTCTKAVLAFNEKLFVLYEKDRYPEFQYFYEWAAPSFLLPWKH